MNQNYVKILGVRIDNILKQKALDKVSTFLESDKQHKIFTPNPEMLVDAQKDEYFKEVLNEGDLNLCDGFGLSLVSRTKKIPGVDFVLDICKLAEEKGSSVYFLGSGNKEVIENLEKNIQQKFPNLKIAGAHPGNNITIEQYNNRTILKLDKEKNNDLISDIVMARPDILFIAFGHGKQEKWIYEYLRDCPNVKVAMGVGGAFDYISGKIKRAPEWMRNIGLEWLYRLIREPKRLKRIWKAVIVFLAFAIFKKSK